MPPHCQPPARSITQLLAPGRTATPVPAGRIETLQSLSRVNRCSTPGRKQGRHYISTPLQPRDEGQSLR